MGRSSSASAGDNKVNQVHQLLHKDRLTKEQLEYCSRACIERYLRARGGNVRKAVKQLKASLAWRDSLEMGYLTADDFTAELAAGTAFVAGRDDNGLPVVVLRMRQQFSGPRWSQKRFLRFLVFTLEVAVACMPPGVEQWVMLVDFAGSSASSSPLSSIFTILKLIADHYPERLGPSFFVDAPSMFYYLWKGMSPFVDYSTREKWRFASSKEHIQDTDACESSSCSSSSCTPSFRHTCPGSVGGGAGGGSYEDRLSAMSFLTPLSSPGGQSFFKRNFMDNSLSAALASDIQHRSLSFSSPASRTSRTPEPSRPFYGSPVFTRSSRSRRCSRDIGSSSSNGGGGGNTIASVLGHNHRSNNNNNSSSKSVDVAFRPYVRMCRSNYNESSYRATMKPPLGGLLSVIRNALTISSPSSSAPC